LDRLSPYKLKRHTYYTSNYNSPSSNNYSSYNNDRRNYRYCKDKNNKRLSNSFKATFKGVKRLKPDEVGYFDKLNKTFIAAYYKRLNFLAYAYKELAILVTLPLYIRANASD
jgi:hypothetical protein